MINLIINYNNSYKYNTVENIYTLGAVKSYLVSNGDLDKLNFGEESYIKMFDENSETCQNLPSDFINQTFSPLI